MPPREQYRLRAAALLIAVSLAGCGAPQGESASGVPSGKGLNVLLISIDTLRADHLGCYGYPRPTSPNIDAFARESVRFEQAISQAPWTTPSHMTLMTSLYPSSHGVNRGFAELKQGLAGTGRYPALAADKVTLAEALHGKGYETMALTGGGTMAGSLGFAQGFDAFVEQPSKIDEKMWRQLSTWLDRPHDRPFFIFFHTFEVHAPYLHADFARQEMNDAQVRNMGQAIARATESEQQTQKEFLEANGLLNRRVTTDLYDGGIHAADAFVGRLLDDLRRRELFDRTLVIIVSDHGESFGEHDPTRIFDAHGDTQYEELIHVPLIIRFPPIRRRSRTVARPVGLIDVAPTVLSLLDLGVPADMQGRSLEGLLLKDDDDLPWTVSEATAGAIRVKAWREERFKYIATFDVTAPGGDPSFIPGPLRREELYDLVADPGEKRDLSRSELELLGLKRHLLFRHFNLLKQRQIGGKAALTAPDDKLERDLKALGYL